MAISRMDPWSSELMRCKRWFGIALLAGFCLQAPGPERPGRRTFTHDRDVQTYSVFQEVPRWDGDLLVGITGNNSSGPVIYTIDREGRKEETLFTFADAGLIYVYEAAASSKGEIAVVGSAYTGDSRGTTFLARIAADHRSQTITRVWPYRAVVVTFAPDGTIWTVGDLKDEENTREIALNVLEHFDSAGKLLGSRTLAVKGWATAETSYLHASRDRVGWFTRANEYLEFSMDGSEIARYDGPEGATEREISGVAMSEENEVVAGRLGKGKAELVTLDRATRTWNPVSLSAGTPEWARVLGFDGTTLVTTTENGRLRRYHTK
jgi:hypothetical protein